MRRNSFGFRSILALLLLAGFYVIAIGLAAFLFYLPAMGGLFSEAAIGRLAIFCYIGSAIILWSLVPRFSRFEAPGLLLDREQYPELFKEICDVSIRAGQDMPAEVYMDLSMNAWVSMRGGFLGMGGRKIMGIGLPLLKYLSMDEFKGVLAHEFGHYHGGDVRLGPVIYRTRASIIRVLGNVGRHSSVLQAPFRAYGKLFLRVTGGISRAQELTADLLAVSIAGKAAVTGGLEKIHRVSQSFSEFWDSEVVPVLSAGYRPDIMEGFELYLKSRAVSEQIANIVEQNLTVHTGVYDTHPSLKERLDALNTLPDDRSIPGDKPAISLVQDVNHMELKLLGLLNRKLDTEKLPAISWTELEEMVYAPAWDAYVKKYGSLILDLKAGGLPAYIRTVDDRLPEIKKLIGGDKSVNDAYNFMGQLTGAAVSLLLHWKGIPVTAAPGEPVKAKAGEMELEPFTVFRELKSGDMSANYWNRVCDALGIKEDFLDAAIYRKMLRNN